MQVTLHTHLLKQKSNKNLQNGFTLVELMVVIALFAILSGIGIYSLLTTQRQSETSSSLNTFIADAKSQQIKAMTGDTDGGTSSSKYGIYFSTNSYTLFTGNSYDPASSSNFVVDLPTGTEFQTINLPSSSIIFNGDGTVDGYSNTQSSVTMENAQGNEQKTIQFNSLGVITGVN